MKKNLSKPAQGAALGKSQGDPCKSSLVFYRFARLTRCEGGVLVGDHSRDLSNTSFAAETKGWSGAW